VPSPLTIYRNIHKLRPGECLRFHAGAVTQELYWRLQFDEQPDSVERLASEFRDRVEAAVTANIAATGTTGAFLSGGTDSSTVSGYLCRARPRASTYSIGFAAEGYDEMEYARIAARHFGSNARELYVTADDVLAGVPLIAAAYDEPFGNASAVPAYHCARLAAADGITRVLAGDGGDEIFGGNARYAKQLTFESYQHLPRALRAGTLEPLLLHTALGGLPLLRKGRSFIEQARVPLPDRLETYNLMNRQPLADVLHPDLLRAVDADHPLQLLRDTYANALTENPLNRMLHLDLKFTLADNDLRKVMRTAALAGIDVRFPLLDEDLVDFSGRLPAALKVRGHQLRWFFKHALRDFLPREILAKSKHGFGLPFGLWLREHPGLRALAEDSLHGLGQRGLIRREYIDRVFDLHRTGHAAYYGVMIWVLLMLEQWLRQREQR
jgi:asparagine synthase (glutamine-hydrolysing)